MNQVKGPALCTWPRGINAVECILQRAIPLSVNADDVVGSILSLICGRSRRANDERARIGGGACDLRSEFNNVLAQILQHLIKKRSKRSKTGRKVMRTQIVDVGIDLHAASYVNL